MDFEALELQECQYYTYIVVIRRSMVVTKLNIVIGGIGTS